MPFLRPAPPPGTVPFTAIDRVAGDVAARARATPAACVILTVDGPAPALSDLCAHIADRIDHAPVLRYRPDVQRRRWVRTEPFDVGPQLRERELKPGADVQAAALDLPPFRAGRPLWDLTLLHGHAPGEYALCYRSHTMFQDGTAVVGTVEALFGRRRLPEPPPNPGRTGPRAVPLPPLRRPAHRRRTPWSLPARTPTGRFAMHAIELDTGRLLTVARAARTTVNQVCLASLTGALRAWTPPDRADHRAALPVQVPLNLWPPERSGALGHHLGLLRVDLPCGAPSPREHLRQVVDQTSERRTALHRALARALAPSMPYTLLRTVVAQCERAGVVGQFVTTLRVASGLTVDGAPVRAVAIAPAPVPLVRLAVAIVFYGPRVTAVASVDTALAGSAGGPERLGVLWHAALAELCALHS
ncbi:wax ester/triacylglycerol synthase domain-containing protein [Actinomadura rayongensis]|uniref:O-acyltransferase WSD1-like N-terminal domain-containing protein n=1 Tax=Actinomadura rayongensis TaxID=1429076 RepID=A0A6I4WEW5_9ACTN|nr:hypothetical protein [Actinomadura rayongensis]